MKEIIRIILSSDSCRTDLALDSFPASSMILEVAQSLPTRITRASEDEEVTVVPQNISSSLRLMILSASPLSMLSSTSIQPSSITQSAGTCIPVCTRIRSSWTISFTAILIHSPSRIASTRDSTSIFIFFSWR